MTFRQLATASVRTSMLPVSTSLLPAWQRPLWTLFALTLFCTADLSALELGEVHLESSIGEPLRASIPLQLAANETLRPGCIRLQPANNNGLRSPTNISSAVTAAAAGGWQLLLQSKQLMREPLHQITVLVDCPGAPTLTRDYMLMLDAKPSPAVAQLSELYADSATADTPANNLAMTATPEPAISPAVAVEKTTATETETETAETPADEAGKSVTAAVLSAAMKTVKPQRTPGESIPGIWLIVQILIAFAAGTALVVYLLTFKKRLSGERPSKACPDSTGYFEPIDKYAERAAELAAQKAVPGSYFQTVEFSAVQKNRPEAEQTVEMPAEREARSAGEQTIEMPAEEPAAEPGTATSPQDTLPMRPPVTTKRADNEKEKTEKEETFEDKLSTTMVQALAQLKKDQDQEHNSSQAIESEELQSALQDLSESSETN
ncbi:MAG: type IV pilus assembly protein FimV [Woeseiaceae bacterium]